MRAYIALATIAVCASLVKAGQLISTYNLIATQPFIFPGNFGTHLTLASPQYYTAPAVAPQEPASFPAHPKAIETSWEESHIPSELKKSDNFYSNPNVATALAKESLNFNKETVIYDRPSEKIERTEIIKLINNLHRAHNE
ncbi:uncharacterized protein LOC143193717 [Rhynchophorus ferrugineus]